jgi:hypothetical protein
MPTASTPDELLSKIRALSPPEQLRLAGELLESQRPRLALAIAKGVVTELEFLHMRGLM